MRYNKIVVVLLAIGLSGHVLAQSPFQYSPIKTTYQGFPMITIPYTEPGAEAKLTPLIMSGPYAEELFRIDAGDQPRGGCNLGKLVRAAADHLRLEHTPPDPSNFITIGTGSVLNFQTFSNAAPAAPAPTSTPTPRPVKEGDEFNVWEVCGDEYRSYAIGSPAATTAEADTGFYGDHIYNGGRIYTMPSEDPKALRARADCIERRIEKQKRFDAFKARERAKVDDALARLVAETEKCTPKEKR